MFDKLFKAGRQGTGYRNLTLFSKHLPKWTGVVGADCHIIHYPSGSFIPPHTDTVESGRHFRLNVVLKHPKRGGEFICPGSFRLFNRIFFFRPDKLEHQVTECKGSRYVFSFGYVLP